MRFFFGQTPAERAREQLMTERVRERMRYGEADSPPAYGSSSGRFMRRVDTAGRATADDVYVDPTLAKYSTGLALVAFRLVLEQGLELEHAEDLNLPDQIPLHGPFEFTSDTQSGPMRFTCFHEGNGTVRFKTDLTGEAEWEVDLRSEREKELLG